MSVCSIFNFIEALFWLFVAALCLRAAFTHDPKFKTVFLTATIGFALFGCSDFVEVATECWWKPYWLIIWKALCIALLIYTFFWHRALKNQ